MERSGYSKGLDRQIRAHGLEARAGQIVDATWVPAPKQHFTREEKEILEQNAVPADWKPASYDRKWCMGRLQLT